MVEAHFIYNDVFIYGIMTTTSSTQRFLARVVLQDDLCFHRTNRREKIWTNVAQHGDVAAIDGGGGVGEVRFIVRVFDTRTRLCGGTLTE